MKIKDLTYNDYVIIAGDFGGAISIDKMHRKEHISWWKEEMPTIEELEEAKNNLARYNNEVQV